MLQTMRTWSIVLQLFLVTRREEQRRLSWRAVAAFYGTSIHIFTSSVRAEGVHDLRHRTYVDSTSGVKSGCSALPPKMTEGALQEGRIVCYSVFHGSNNRQRFPVRPTANNPRSAGCSACRACAVMYVHARTLRILYVWRA